MQSDINKVRKGVMAKGRIQGVSFRYFVQACANLLDATGWVRKMRDGSLIMELQGTAPIIEQLIEQIKKGNGRIKVTKFEIFDLPVEKRENKFAIKY